MSRATSSLVAGVVAAVVWVVIALIVGLPGGSVVIWAAVLLVGVAAVTFAVSSAIGAAARRRV